MRMFLDSAHVNEIREALDMWDIDGLTTNPRHVAAAGRPINDILDEIGEIFSGTEKPVSVEVDPHLTDWTAIVEEGVRLAEISENFVIKVGAGEAGYRAVQELSEHGIRTNVTLVFSTTQAWHAARCGATFVSPFLGWKEAHGDDVSTFIGEISLLYENFGYPTQIIAAAIRNSRQIADAALAGAHCVTAGVAVYRESFANPYTDMGHRVFGDAWDSITQDESSD